MELKAGLKEFFHLVVNPASFGAYGQSPVLRQMSMSFTRIAIGADSGPGMSHQALTVDQQPWRNVLDKRLKTPMKVYLG